MANLWSIFGKLDNEAIINTIAQATGNLDQSRNIYKAITATLEKQMTIRNAIKSKSAINITRKDQESLKPCFDKLSIPLEISKYHKKRKTSKLKRQVNLYYFDIKELRKENVSWIGITKYLKEKHKIKISHTQLRNLFLELQKTLENQYDVTKN